MEIYSLHSAEPSVHKGGPLYFTQNVKIKGGSRVRVGVGRAQVGLLALLADGKQPPDRDAAIAMTERLRKDLGHMLHEHKAIVIELHKLMEAAKSENKPEYVRFAEKLKLHAQTEEEVLSPSAILIGEYLKLKQDER